MRLFLVALMITLCIGASPMLAVETNPQETVGAPEKTTERPAAEKPEATVGDNMGGVGEVLLVFLVLSLAFEVALTPIFNWRVFMAHLEGKGYKTPITVALAFVVFWGYGLDIIRDLLVALKRPAEVSIGGQILTALLIAGGSSGIFQIFTKLKIRMDLEERRVRTEEAKQSLAKRRASNKSSTKTGS